MASKRLDHHPKARSGGGRGVSGPGRRTTSGSSRWSRHVMQTSNALDLESGVFMRRSPHEIALSLKRSVEASRRRKAEPFRSAMSMLTFHINRAGKNLTPQRRRALDEAKHELRVVFHRDRGGHSKRD